MKIYSLNYQSNSLTTNRFACFSWQGIIPLSVLLVFFFQAATLTVAGTISSNTDNLYGESSESNLDPSMGIVILILVCVFFIIGCIVTYIRGCSEAAAVSTGTALSYGRYQGGYPRSIAGLDRSEIDSFPTLVYTDVKKLKIRKRALECAVCLAEFDGDDRLRLLPKCEHVFHPECIDPWLTVQSTCPVCRSDLMPIAAEIRSGNNELTVPMQRPDGEFDESELGDDEERVDVEMPATPAKFVKSNSTGHSLISSAGEENSDRFRLRLPEEMRRQIHVEAKFRRAKSFGALPRASSLRKGYRSGDEGGNSPSGRLLRWTRLVKSAEDEEVTATRTNAGAILVAIVVN